MDKLPVYRFILVLVVVIGTAVLIATDKLGADVWSYVLSGVFGLVVGYSVGKKDNKPPKGLLTFIMAALVLCGGLYRCAWFQEVKPAIDAVEACSKIYLKAKLCADIKNNDVLRVCTEIIDMGGAHMWDKLKEILDVEPKKDVPECHASFSDPNEPPTRVIAIYAANMTQKIRNVSDASGVTFF